METGVNKVLKTLGDPTFKAKPKDVKIKEVGIIVGEVFDFTELSQRTLGQEWKKMKAFYRFFKPMDYDQTCRA